MPRRRRFWKASGGCCEGGVEEGNPPKTRHDRAEAVRQEGIGDFAGEMKELLLGILKAYETAGETELAGRKLGQFLTARYGSVSEGRAKLGELQIIRDAFNHMQTQLYAE